MASRFILGRGGAVAATASAIGAPSSSHCRAQTQNRGGLPNSSKGDKDASLAVKQAQDGGHLTNRLIGEVDQEWLVTDVYNNNVMFGPEEISEVVNTVMGMPAREAPKALVGSDVAIHEVRDDLSDSDESNATDANEYMHAAGMQVVRANSERENMVQALNNLLNQPNVQSVVLRHLLEDPTVQTLINDRNRVAGDTFLPQAARAGFEPGWEEVPSDADPEHEGSNSIKNIAERVAANIVNLGQHIRDSAAHLLVNLGYQIHQLLGRPFKQAAEGKSAEKSNEKSPQEWLPKVLMTVGCAVITLLLFKRLRIV
ncbi:hypothetical protein COCSUDRAFT_43248 [Coccomyxa subellipsoidea C-169]|uniref:Uncharacterized protein n=1 Tax=Coccomyxa subellipsoidea (strain C-169) TaxID=574566 RepID=I0YT29_COCSC|nr:hypothetical protein COCSUDRAFT_43248 [Coccomyxa subellipsoidea C-169]EIE21548.1 hypothetical protein COCSUDRAFT_43248 [Coccomyxa subellipsoidea C-169]|eukprot:XP_005646092.1 hypothetical protein COCSUDRAFT_43248 [Coccomyxa subellipsoidea C-169]